MRTGYEIREGSRMLAERITLKAEDRGPVVRKLGKGEREINGRIRYCKAWEQAA